MGNRAGCDPLHRGSRVPKSPNNTPSEILMGKHHGQETHMLSPRTGL
jgi:hypothetical protein